MCIVKLRMDLKTFHKNKLLIPLSINPFELPTYILFFSSLRPMEMLCVSNVSIIYFVK